VDLCWDFVDSVIEKVISDEKAQAHENGSNEKPQEIIAHERAQDIGSENVEMALNLQDLRNGFRLAKETIQSLYIRNDNL